MTTLNTPAALHAYMAQALGWADLDAFTLAPVPAGIAAQGWVPVPDDEFDCFDFSTTPRGFGSAQQIATTHYPETLYVYCADDFNAQYFKFHRAYA
jgi:hypothetical protein